MSLMTNSSTGDISTMVAELLYALCKENVGRLVSQNQNHILCCRDLAKL